MTDLASGNRSGRQRRHESPSEEELDFRRRWQFLIDRLGGQSRAAEKMDWSPATVSRDYLGQTLPSSQRRLELCNYINLTQIEQEELHALFVRAKEARERRLSDSGPAGEEPAPSPDVPAPGDASAPEDVPSAELAQPSGGRRPYPWRVIAGVAVVIVAGAVTASVLTLSPSGNPAAAPSTASTNPGVHVSSPGNGVKTVSIPAESLRGTYSQVTTGTVTGYEFRDALSPSLCLTAVDTGPLAGQDGDPVEAAPCTGAANQVWIPVDWGGVNGKSYTHLSSEMYPNYCLNARKDGAAAHPGDAIILYRCLPRTGNEAWEFSAWYRSAAQHQSYPICLSNALSYCIDADERPDVPAGVHLWNHQVIGGEFWS